MEEIRDIKKRLIAEVQIQMDDLDAVDTKELGEVIDMIKDLSEVEYYCEKIKQIEKESM